MKRLIVAVFSFWPLAGMCDLSDEDPNVLCKLLEPYGIFLTEYEIPNEELRPFCFVRSQPTSANEDGYEYSYRVISHFKEDYPDSLFLQLSGTPSQILGQEPHARYMKMAAVILSSIYSQEVVDEIVLAIESISPGFNRHMKVEGLGIQLRAIDYSQRSADMDWLEIRFDVRNTCYFTELSDHQAKCLAERKGSLAE